MLNFKRKVVAYVLIFITEFSVLFSIYGQCVYAAEYLPGVIKGVSDIVAFYNAIGEVIGQGFAQDFYDKYKDQFDAIQGIRNSDGTVSFSEDAVAQLRDLFDEYLASTPEAVDMVWMPVVSSDDLSSDWFNSLTSYYQFRSMTDDTAYNYVYYGLHSGEPCLYYADVSACYPVCSNGADVVFNQINYWTSIWGSEISLNVTMYPFYLYDSDGLDARVEYHSAYGYYDNKKIDLSAATFYVGGVKLIYPFSIHNAGSSNYRDAGFYVRGCNTDAASFVPVFRDKMAFIRWMTGQGSYYRFESGYTGGDITINPDADYSQITDAIADVMKQSIANGDTMAKMLSQMQVVFSKTLADISGTLGDIGDNTAETNSWLEKIYQLLEEQQKELQDYIESSGKTLDDLIGLLSHTDEDGNTTSIYTVLAEFLLLFRVQQEDLQNYIADAQNFFKTLPVKIGAFIKESTTDITDALEEVKEAILGISINIDYGDVDGGSDGESLWTQLGKGLAKILTAVLDLLKVLIFKGLDALGYLVGVMIANIGQVFDGVGAYFDRYIGYIEENTFFAAIKDILPEELQTIMVLSFFSVAVAGIIRYAKKG